MKIKEKILKLLDLEPIKIRKIPIGPLVENSITVGDTTYQKDVDFDKATVYWGTKLVRIILQKDGKATYIDTNDTVTVHYLPLDAKVLDENCFFDE